MNRRSFFRLVAGAGGWLATQHVAWAFAEPVHAIPQRFLCARIAISRKVLSASNPGAFMRCAQAEWAGMARDMQHQEELMILKNRMSR